MSAPLIRNAETKQMETTKITESISKNQIFADQTICGILARNKLITQHQSEEILRKKEWFKKELKRRHSSQACNNISADSVSITDVIVSLNLKRADNIPGTLDEETIYSTLTGMGISL